MMRQHVPEISAGVLLSYWSEVHHDTGHRDTGVLLTRCGKAAKADRVASCTALQAVVYQLGLCAACYPDGRGNGRRVGGGRP